MQAQGIRETDLCQFTNTLQVTWDKERWNCRVWGHVNNLVEKLSFCPGIKGLGFCYFYLKQQGESECLRKGKDAWTTRKGSATNSSTWTCIPSIWATLDSILTEWWPSWLPARQSDRHTHNGRNDTNQFPCCFHFPASCKKGSNTN